MTFEEFGKHISDQLELNMPVEDPSKVITANDVQEFLIIVAKACIPVLEAMERDENNQKEPSLAQGLPGQGPPRDG